MVLAQRPYEKGMLTYYGDTAGNNTHKQSSRAAARARGNDVDQTSPPHSQLVSDRDLSERDVPCGTNIITCDTKHTIDGTTCRSLIAALNNTLTLAVSPRAICYGQSGAQCCVSWSKVVCCALERQLIPSAQRVLDECWGEPWDAMSGQEIAVNLELVCVTQCLSNRPKGCGN